MEFFQKIAIALTYQKKKKRIALTPVYRFVIQTKQEGDTTFVSKETKVKKANINGLKLS